tara:strand:- start:1210 stop:1515 length:306 start_codon:yes stop_codon:yes gene_type:complete
MARKPRTMPPKGFYVMKMGGHYDEMTKKGYMEAYYTTGVRGGGGHKYCRCMGDSMSGYSDFTLTWGGLTWTCVPGIKPLNAHYDFYPTHSAIPASYGIPKL